MASPDEETCAFILRFWREPRAMEGADPIWRGVVEHVPTGQRRYVKNVDELVSFILSHLREIGVVIGWRWRLWVWWQARRLASREQQLSQR